jgi:tetratricopeptide (TPR) repeat protein
MTKDRTGGKSRSPLFFCGLCLVCALLIKPVQDHLESTLGPPSQEPDLLFFNSPALVKKMSLGYDGLLADFYWMRVIQYYGRRDEADRRLVRYKNLATLLDITTTLDPGLLDAYSSGSIFLSEPDPVGAGEPWEALRLLDKGIEANPLEWRLLFDKGFIYYLHLKDYKAAGDAWLSASKLPEAPGWLKNLAAISLSKGGSIEIAIALWQRQYRESTRENLRENARNHLLSFQVARDLWTLESMIQTFKSETGSYPGSLKELVRKLNIPAATEDPLGAPYGYDSRTGAVYLGMESDIRYFPVSEIYKEQLLSLK